MTDVTLPRAAVASVYVKTERGRPMTQQPALTLDRDGGIIGDCQARNIGPRQVLLIAAETLDEFGLTHDLLRANVVTCGVALDDLESGAVLRFETGVRLRLTHRCEVCGQVVDVAGKRVARALLARRGYLAVVLNGGLIPEGTAITVESPSFPQVPDAVGDRFLWVARRIPAGRVLSFATMRYVVGSAQGHFRAFPRYICRGQALGLAMHRLVDSRGGLLSYVEGHREKLFAEGVDVRNGTVPVDEREWDSHSLYTVTEPLSAARRRAA